MNRLTNIAAAGILAGLMVPGTAMALGPDSYLGTVGLSGASYCPKGLLEANGQLLGIAQFSNLYAVFGNRYGGDGMTSFGLPDLTDKVPEKGMRYCVVVTGGIPPHN
ncbi:MAG: phage tail protein [Rhodobacter sp.]|nr:phage tail protein [Rhodobacter sp.]